MRLFIFIFLFIFSLNTYSFDHSYDVSGEDENGESVEGTIYSTNGERNVTGEIVDQKGETHNFDGQWDGYGQISGETDEGVSMDLNTN